MKPWLSIPLWSCSDFMMPKLSNSVLASGKIALKEMSEPCISCEGVFVGHTEIYRTPFFLDHDSLLNRHMAVVGMTGSGKTYFLKSHITRCVSILGYSLFIIDWNGEYDEVITFLGGRTIKPEGLSEQEIANTVEIDGITSINLTMIRDDSVKRAAAELVMKCIISIMRCTRTDQAKRRIVLLDEAWKMVGDKSVLEQLFREGRKYGISVCIATQLVNDIDSPIIANCACLAIFKLQNSSDYSVLSSSGIITSDMINEISALKVGACMMHLAPKNGQRAKRFFIKRICGISSKSLLIGDKMRCEVTEARLSKALELFVSDIPARARIMDYVLANGWKVGAAEFVRMMGVQGMERSDIVPMLRYMGLEDISIVRAYSEAEGAILVSEHDQLSV